MIYNDISLLFLMTDYRFIYIDFHANKHGVSGRRSMNLNDKTDYIFEYHEKARLNKINQDWASCTKVVNVPNHLGVLRQITLYVPLHFDGNPTCIPDKDFFAYEKKRFDDNNKRIEDLTKELEDERKCSQALREEIKEISTKLSEKTSNEAEKDKPKPTKTTRKKAIPKKVKLLVWNLYIGENNVKGLCHCCKKTEIKNTDFHCGHFISEKNNGETTVDNLRPICSGCNLSMGAQNMDDFMKYMI